MWEILSFCPKDSARHCEQTGVLDPEEGFGTRETKGPCASFHASIVRYELLARVSNQIPERFLDGVRVYTPI